MSIPNLIAHCLGPSSSIGVWSTYKSLILDVDWHPIPLKPEVGHVSPAWMLASFVLYRQPELLWVHWYRNSIISRDTIFIWTSTTAIIIFPATPPQWSPSFGWMHINCSPLWEWVLHRHFVIWPFVRLGINSQHRLVSCGVWELY